MTSANAADNKAENKKPLLGIYTPELQGFYFGELVGQLLTLCRIKDYRVTVIKTGGFGKFKSAIHSEAMDMVIILRNAIHTELAKSLIDNGKSVVSISFDYFPLNIPLVTTDSEAGVELAVSHLVNKGHKKFLFVGNLTNFDVRKRYEAFCDQVEQHKLETWDEEVFPVVDDLISGGYEAADRYLETGCNATAIIFGTAMNGIGFSRRLGNQAQDLKNLVGIAVFDAISLIPVLNPDITTVDQNLNLVAHKALSVVDGTAKANREQHHFNVSPKLITSESDFMRSDEAYLATSFELAELYNANYIKSILCNITAWSQSIASAKLDNIMVLRTLFRRYLEKVTVSRAVTGKSGSAYLVYTKLIGTKGVAYVDIKDPAGFVVERAFPKAYLDFIPEDYDTCFHLPRFIRDEIWGFISAYGKTDSDELPCSYTGFTAFLDHIIEWMNQGLLTPGGGEKADDIPVEKKVQVGRILWNTETNEVLWDDAALRLLGFVSELEQKIYQNMELYNRIDEACINDVREYLLEGKSGDLPIQVRFKKKSREYVACELSLEGVDEKNNSVIKISLALGED